MIPACAIRRDSCALLGAVCGVPGDGAGEWTVLVSARRHGRDPRRGGGAVVVKVSTSTFAQNCSNGDLTSWIDGGMYNVFCSFAR